MELGELKPKILGNPLEAAASESTKIEQARTFAEVAMQVDLAKRYPRNMDDVFQRIEETFERSPGLLLKAKWKPFRRGGQEIIGYTIQFARAIAECVGNIKYSFRELSRIKGQSEMMIYAWDMQTNTIQDRTIIIPHTRDKTDYNTKKQFTEPIIHERDIYENNANFASRRLRECILGVLPAAARRKGEEVVESLLKKAFPEEKIQEYINKAVDKFKKMGISRAMLVKERGGRPPETWTRNDIVTLKSYAEDIANGDTMVADIFEIKDVSSIKPPPPKKKTKRKQPPAEETPAYPKPADDAPKLIRELYAMIHDPAYKEAVEKLLPPNEFKFFLDNWDKDELVQDCIQGIEDFYKDVGELTSELNADVIQLQEMFESEEFKAVFKVLADAGTLKEDAIKKTIKDADGQRAQNIIELVKNSK